MDFLEQAQELFGYAQALRRDFHAHPELGFHEIRTGGIVAQELERLGMEVAKGIGKTGVAAFLEGGKPGPTVLLRFDMDALPITEETGAEYASQTPGVMHACGHDGHVAIGLTVAKILSARKSELAGNVKFCFQPSEEGLNGEEVGGAQMMMRDGILNGVDKTLALHLWNDKPFGWVHAAAGPVMAGAELFTVKIFGKGGHGAMPHTTRDPIAAATQVVSALQTVVSRNVSPLRPAVVSVTSIHSGTTFNVIPQEAELQGTIRTFDAAVRQTVLERFEKIIHAAAEALGCGAEINMVQLAPAVLNDERAALAVQAAVRNVLPEAALDTSPYLTMGAEDMAFMQEKVPGCYFFVGSANAEKNLNYGHHHPKFDFDERALISGAALMAAAAAELLSAPAR